MFFASDNNGPAHPAVMAALVAANDGHAGAYGADEVTAQAIAAIRATFEAPEAAVFLLGTGTAANALTLATLTPPWGTVFCTPMAHVNEDECNAPEFFTGGAKLTLVSAPQAKLTPGALDRAIAAEGGRGVHGPARGPVSLTQATEKGTIYTIEDLRAISDLAHGYGLPVQMDGARFANALVRLGCSAAEMTWKAGIDAVSFGGSKNGLLGVEAVVFFDPARAGEFAFRRKRGGHLFSKHRYLAAQMGAYLAGGLWLDMARTANARADRLAEGLRAIPGVSLVWPPEANLMFFRAPRRLHRRLLDAGASYHVWDGDPQAGDAEAPLIGRLVCDWSTTPAEVDEFLTLAFASG